MKSYPRAHIFLLGGGGYNDLLMSRFYTYLTWCVTKQFSNLRCGDNNSFQIDRSDFQELSPINMLRLSSIVSSRSTLSLHSTVMNSLSAIPGCLERQNLYRFISRMPSLNNYYSSQSFPQPKSSTVSSKQLVKPFYCSHNLLPKTVLDSSQYDLATITKIQSRLFDRSNSNDDNAKPRRRKIDLSYGCGQSFDIVVVSDFFQGKSKLMRSRAVNKAVKEELQEIHAFSCKCYTEEEWSKIVV